MRVINIQSTPNQEFTVNIGEYRYDITLKLTSDGVEIYDISIDKEPVIQGQRLTAGVPLLVYRYQEVDGNFYLQVPDGEDVDYQQFGESQILYYLTPDEMERLRNGD